MKPAAFFTTIVLLISCSSKKGPTYINPAFYYWSTEYKITGTDSKFLQQSGCKKMYVRFFDVGLSDNWEGVGDIVPKGRLEHKQPFIQEVETIPVVFIENDIFLKKQDEQELQWLVSKITTKLFRMARNHGLPEDKIKEIQLDCDWTDKTRDTYFTFLKLFRQQCGNKKLSVTLRLYQYKYRTRSGIPPADRCMLMYYNMSNLKEKSTENYILDNTTGKKYISDVEAYPLPLDFALPIYSQGVEFYSFDSTFHGLRNMTIQDTAGQKIWRFDVRKGSLYMQDKNYDYNYTRFEFVTPENLEEASVILTEAVNTDTFSVSFFHLDEKLYTPIGHETFKEVIDLLGGR